MRVLFFVAALALVPSISQASTPKLEVGMTMEQVIESIGYPVQVQVSPNGKQQIWRYTDQNLCSAPSCNLWFSEKLRLFGQDRFIPSRLNLDKPWG